MPDSITSRTYTLSQYKYFQNKQSAIETYRKNTICGYKIFMYSSYFETYTEQSQT